MTRPVPRDLETTLMPRGDPPRQVAWDEITDPSLHAAPQLPLDSTRDDGEQPRVGRYTVLRKLGAGGMGVVYAAFDESLDRKVAIKVLRDRQGDPEGQGRLLREAQALARLSHPNVVGVHDVGTTGDGQIYIAMEFITGTTLRGWLEEQPRPRAEILRVFTQAGRGLAAAHAVGLIHRDFKPENVMVGNDGRVCVFDFGLARSATDHEPGERPGSAPHPRASVQRLISSMTLAGTLLGTPAYMAAEQHEGTGTDARTDIFSFCVALYEALYGERPFAGQNYGELVANVRAGVIRPAPLGVQVPSWLRQILVRGLQPVPADRWKDLPTLLAALAADPAVARGQALRMAGLVAFVVACAIGLPYLYTGLERAWARDRSERLATQHWRVVQARIATLEEAGEGAEAEAAFAAFVRAEEHRGTRALTQAWIDRGARRLRAEDHDEALTAFARAYTEATDPALEIAAMQAMAAIFRDAWAWEPLSQALVELRARGAGDDPAILGLGVDEALIHRDLRRASDLLAPGDPAVPANLAAARPLLATLSGMTRTGLPGREVSVCDLNGDGRDDLVLLDSTRSQITLVDHDLHTLHRERTPGPVSHLVPGLPRALVHDGQQLRLYDLTGDQRLLWSQRSASKPYTVAVLDPQDDGQPDLYLGLEPPARSFVVLPDLATTAPDAALRPATQASNSDLEGLVAADLDGDGTRELVAAVSAWSAYDLRLYQPGPAGLQLRAHRRLGRVAGVAILRGADGRQRIAVAKDDAYPNREVFPAPPHTGEPAGVYLLRWTGRELVQDDFIPFPLADGRSGLQVGRFMQAADLDGDGLDDLVIAASRDVQPESQRDLALVLRQRSDGEFAMVALGGMVPVGLFDADDDPARELLAFATDAPDDLWILGAGVDAMAPLPRPPRTLIDPPAELDAPELERAWQRASQLERVGLGSAAATTLRDAAHFAADLHHRRILLDRAGDIALAHGDAALAGELYRQVTADAELGPRALAKTAEAAALLGRYGDAVAALQAIAELTTGDPALLEQARTRLAELEPLARPSASFHLDFSRPLLPAWHIEDPTLVRRDPAAGVLRVTAFPDPHELAALAIAWDGGPLRVQVDLSREHLELGSSLRVVIRGDDGSVWLGSGVRASGGGGLVDASLQCWNRHHGVWDSFASHPQATAEASEALHLRIEHLPGLGAATCVASGSDGATQRHRGGPAAPAPPGRYWLSIGSYPDREVELAMARVAIRSIHVDGARLLTDVDDRPLARARRALADDEPLTALAELALSDEHDPRIPIWEAVARDDLHQSADAVAALRRALPPPADATRTPPGAGPSAQPDPQPDLHPLAPALARLLHLRPTSMGAALRELLGPRFFAAYADAWAQAIHHHRYDAYLHRQLTEDLADLAGFAPRSQGEWALKCRLLALRGRSWLRLGADERAREDLRAAALLLDHVPPGEARHIVAPVWLMAARALAATDPGEALRFASIAVATSPTPALISEQLRDDPELAALRDDPAWRGVFAPVATAAAPTP
ncbi:serine/threonine-protein kinase [Nannocystis sp.]|uniref:serine/threonine-protein kinase n=1 Tax=Nannocystis sp. TaxID=1962667 RepID=UPI0025F8B9F3|nr:serine/threonine-protein kinase [Nannocystis sp.]MBK7824026.1 serine/threonine protein kinase [Nannocystis sp.]